MSTKRGDRRVDAKGRVTIPRAVREQLGIDPGERVEIDVEDGAVVIRPRISRTEAVETLEGCVNAATRRAGAEPTTPEGIKADWTSDLPGE